MIKDSSLFGLNKYKLLFNNSTFPLVSNSYWKVLVLPVVFRIMSSLMKPLLMVYLILVSLDKG